MLKKLFIIILGLVGLVSLHAKVINVGSEKAYKPFAYLDENGRPSGFDIDVIRLIASYDDSLEINFINVPWNAIFVGLDSKKFDVVANQISKTPERLSKYLYTKESYFNGSSVLIVHNSSNINDPKELKNKTIGVTVGSNHSLYVEKYIKENPQLNIKIKYYKSTPPLFKDFQNKRIDAMVNDPAMASQIAKDTDVDIKFTDYVFKKVPSYFIFRKEDKDIADKFDNALIKAKKEGKLSELSIKYFGVDLTN